MKHNPVMIGEVITILDPQPGERVCDATVGLGGHAQAFIERIGKEGSLIAIDADAKNLEHAQEQLRGFSNGEFTHANFSRISSLSIGNVDIIFADLGLSSPHVDDPSRGFSFREEGPLDLRFDQTRGQTAAEFLHTSTMEDIAAVLHEYGELKHARKIAEVIKSTETMQTTGQLKASVERACGFRAASMLPQVFQALRIAVNGELEALEIFLQEAPQHLSERGRMAVISYHSLEDRMVKHAFRKLTAPQIDDRTGAILHEALFLPLTKKPLKPAAAEVQRNPRSRSAKLRAVRRSGL